MVNDVVLVRRDHRETVAMRRRRQHHLIAWTVLWAVVGALFALGTERAGAATQLVFWDASACSGSGTVHVVITWTNNNCCGIPNDQGSVDLGMSNRIGNQQITGSFANSLSGISVTFNGALAATGDGSSAHPFAANAPNGCTPTCNTGVNVTAHWDGGAPEAAGVVVNLVVGGILAQISCDGNGCNSGTIPAAQLNLMGSPPWSVDTYADANNWAICGPPGNRYRTTPTIVAAPPTVNCGGSVNVVVHSNCSPSPTPSPSPSASIAPSPSTTPVLTPSPFPTPINSTTPPPNNPGTTVTNGGTTGSGISNQDIYNDVKQALDDAGNRDSTFTTPNGGFGFGNDPGGENGSAGNGLQSAVDRFTNDLSGSGDGLMEKVDAIDSLSLPTSIGDKSSWAVSLPVLGDLTIDLSTFDGPVWAFRSLCLAILVVGAWFAIVKIVRSGVA